MSFQAYLDNIQAKTGKSRADFRKLATFTLGPVFNACNELVGLALTAWYTRGGDERDWSAVEYVIQPWSEISNCIRVQSAPFLRRPNKSPPISK
jgi:hypothetical protein